MRKPDVALHQQLLTWLLKHGFSNICRRGLGSDDIHEQVLSDLVYLALFDADRDWKMRAGKQVVSQFEIGPPKA
jgi:hypothetical protein